MMGRQWCRGLTLFIAAVSSRARGGRVVDLDSRPAAGSPRTWWCAAGRPGQRTWRRCRTSARAQQPHPLTAAPRTANLEKPCLARRGPVASGVCRGGWPVQPAVP
jgi:hypothetical protein